MFYLKISEKTKTSFFVDQYCFNLLKNLFTLEELKDMHILIDYIFTDGGAFVKYTNDASPNHGSNGIKLEEKLIVFIIEPKNENINNLIFSDSMMNGTKRTMDFGIIFVPEETPKIIEYLMKMNSLNTNFQLYSFNMEIIPIDADLYSMNIEDSFREIYVEKNYDSISKLASIVLKFQAAFGKVKHKYIKGDKAKLFNDFLTLKEEEHNIRFNDEILGMIVLDRSADFITPLLRNTTYEGMMDDCFGINKGCVKVKKSFVKSNFKPEHKKKRPEEYLEYPLTSDINKFYCKLRCMNFQVALRYITNITQSFTQKMKMNDETQKTSEMTEFFTQWNQYVHLQDYLRDNEGFLNYILKQFDSNDFNLINQKEKSLINGYSQTNSEIFYSDYISEKKDFNTILNLMVIESLTQGGLKNYAEMKRDMLNIYGYQKIFLFRNLEALGWLKEKDKLSLKSAFKSDYRTICENLNLIYKDFKIGKTDDLSYIKSGFCPISLKLIEKAGEGEWTSIKDSLNLIPGETVFPNDESEISNPTEKINTIFVVFVGGVTYSEIEGIRFLNRKYKQIYDRSDDDNKTRKQFIIITTQIFNSKRLYDNLGKNFGSVYTMKKFYDDLQETPTKKK